ncbi:MAG: c-type cytochrome [Rubrivivax sp.]|nr:c-type cytochrome [Rubrivivax sp.]
MSLRPLIRATLACPALGALSTLAVALPLLLHGQPATAAGPGADPRGAFLAANCANCHGTQGRAEGAMPPLAGRPAAQTVLAMRQFRDGQRPATLMHQIARGYRDDEVAAIAAYFEAQK